MVAGYYDPTIGRFTATDPIIDAAQPGSLDRYGYGYDNPVTLSDPTGLYVELENRGSVGLARQSKLASIGAAPKPVTGRYHARWPSRRAVPRAPEDRRGEPATTPFSRDTGSVRLDGNRYPIPRPATREVPVVDGHDDLRRVGTCGGFSVFAYAGGSFSGCSITIDGEHGFSFTPGAGAGSPSVAVGGGDVFSNARSLEEFTWGAWCGSVGYAVGMRPGGSGTGCSSVGSGVYTLYAGLGFEARPGLSTAMFYAETEVVSSASLVEDVTSWARDLTDSLDQLVDMFGGGGLL